MALVIEDGTGIEGAEVVNSITDADDYCTKRGIASWAGLTEEQKSAALINGQEYICDLYGARVIGLRKNPKQGLPFPTVINGLPENYKKAEMIAALESLQPGGLWVVLDPTAKFQTEQTIGPITNKWAAPSGGTPQQQQKKIDRIDALLAGLIKAESFEIEVYRG